MDITAIVNALLTLLAGIGVFLIACQMMSSNLESASSEKIKQLFSKASGSKLLGVGIGTLGTAAIQSSGATTVMTSIALAMVVSGLIGIDQGIYLTMGSNIGSCVVAVIAGMTSGTNAKRTALIHLLFNCSGVILFMLAALALGWLDVSYGSIFSRLFPSAPQTQLAMFHTVFNVITVAVMLPLTRPLVSLVSSLIPEKPVLQEEALSLRFVDENMLRTPPVAVSQVKREILWMGSLAMENVDRSLQMAVRLDFWDKQKFEHTEQLLNYMNQSLIGFVSRLNSGTGLNQKDRAYLNTTYRSVRDLERIGDYAENIVEYATALSSSGQEFSDDAKYEISQLKGLLHQLYDHMVNAYRDEDFEALAKANVVEEQIDGYTKSMEDGHITRMEKGICTSSVGAQYLELSSNAERIADHMINVAKTIRSL